MTDSSQHIQGPSDSMLEKYGHHSRLVDSFSLFDAPEMHGSSMVGIPRDDLPFSTDFPSFYENQMSTPGTTVYREPEHYQMPSPRPIILHSTSSNTYRIRKLDTLDQSMLESASHPLNDSGYGKSSVYNPVGQAGSQQHGPASISSSQPHTAMDSLQPPPFQTGKGRIGSLANNAQNSARLIDREVVLWLLFKYILRPMMEDIENIASDTGYSFDFVIGSYCQYRKGVRTGYSTFNELRMVRQSISDSQTPGILEIRLSLLRPDRRIGKPQQASYQAATARWRFCC
jgi:hypothetical protein